MIWFGIVWLICVAFILYEAAQAPELPWHD